MSHWNYRIIARKTPISPHSVYFGIYEVYYNDDGIPYLYTEDPVSFEAEVSSELEEDLKWAIEGTKKPILWGDDDFPKEYE